MFYSPPIWNYYIKTNDGWVLTGRLKGFTGSSGKSAYDIYLESHPGYTGDEN